MEKQDLLGGLRARFAAYGVYCLLLCDSAGLGIVFLKANIARLD